MLDGLLAQAILEKESVKLTPKSSLMSWLQSQVLEVKIMPMQWQTHDTSYIQGQLINCSKVIIIHRQLLIFQLGNIDIYIAEIENITNSMTDPYNHPFLQKDNTMYLSTITKQDFQRQEPFYRESSFLNHDIAGTNPKELVSKQGRINNFVLSTFVEPIPDRNKHINKTSNPLMIDDIEGARPKACEFKSKRIVDPLCPKYLLPSASEIVIDNGRKFIRDTLDTTDINGKRSNTWQNRGREIIKPQVEGSSPVKLTRELKMIQRLQVKDINKDGLFQSTRRTNPLTPNYNWRDNDDKQLNNNYGIIKGSEVRQVHPTIVNRPNSFCLGIGDIQGTQANSSFAKSHFVDKRRQFRNYMTTQDIQKAGASSLKKGIVTRRQVNPLMPNYQLLGNTQTK